MVPSSSLNPAMANMPNGKNHGPISTSLSPHEWISSM
jgi:hypothetical protein